MIIGNGENPTFLHIEVKNIEERHKQTKGGARIDLRGDFFAETRKIGKEFESKATFYLTSKQCGELIKLLRIAKNYK